MFAETSLSRRRPRSYKRATMRVFGKGSPRATFALLAISLASACSDVGDNTAAPPGMDGGDDTTIGPDATSTSDDTGTQPPGSDAMNPADDSSGQNPTPESGFGSDDVGEVPDSVGPTEQETGMPESGEPEAGAPDTGIDATIEDSGPDVEVADVGIDQGIVDAGLDSTIEQEGGVDAGHDAGHDAGFDAGVDASTDAGHDSGGGLGPCTTSGQTGCVSCTGSTGGLCTTDEAFYVEKDINEGNVTAPVAAKGTYPASSCYACLLTNGCIDSPSHHVGGVECDDFKGNFTNGSGASVPAASTCLQLVKDLLDGSKNSCLLGQPSGSSSTIGNDTFCYCGPGGYGTGANQGLQNCQNASASAVNGVDLTDEVAGFSSTVPGTNLGNYNSDPTEPSAIANLLAECARGSTGTSIATSTCPLCLQ
jgi:hypothetical protein